MNSKRVFRFITFFGLLGAVLTSWIAPKVIAWYFDPPVNIGVNCKLATEWSMSRLQTSQTVGLLAGAVLGLVLAIVFRKKSPGVADPSYPVEPQL